jgi:hypothetical protein
MSEGLRNTGSTFYRMTKTSLKDQVGRNMLSYVDGIVMVSKMRGNYIVDLVGTFTNMCKARLKLNPEKCVFGITKRKVLGCLISTIGIEANPDKIKAITQMQPPQSSKGVQKLTGRIASLNRFISKLLLAFLSHRIICKRTDVNCSIHPRVFQNIKSTGKQ